MQEFPGRHFWLTVIMVARFLASAFSGGPALVIILALIIRKTTKFDPEKNYTDALQDCHILHDNKRIFLRA